MHWWVLRHAQCIWCPVRHPRCVVNVVTTRVTTSPEVHVANCGATTGPAPVGPYFCSDVRAFLSPPRRGLPPSGDVCVPPGQPPRVCRTRNLVRALVSWTGRSAHIAPPGNSGKPELREPQGSSWPTHTDRFPLASSLQRPQLATCTPSPGPRLPMLTFPIFLPRVRVGRKFRSGIRSGGD